MDKHKIMIVGVFIISLLIRLIAINQSLWLDEGIVVQTVLNNNLITLINKHMVGEFHPPFYYILMWFWVRIFGSSELWLRMPSVLANIALLAFFYLWIKNRTNSFPRLIGFLLLLSTSPLLFYYSQEARMYSLATMLVFASMWAYRRWLDGKKEWAWRYVGLTWIMLLTHYTTWFVYFVQIILILSYYRKKEKNWIKVLLMPSLVILLNLPLLIMQIISGLKISNNLPVWQNLSEVSIKNIILIPVKFFSGHVSVDNIWVGTLVLLEIGIWTYIVLKPILISGIIKMTIYQRLIWVWLLVPLAIGIMISFKIPMLSYFRFLYLAPIIYLLLLEYLKFYKSKKDWIIYIMIGINLFMLSNYLFNKNNQREDWRSVATYIKNQNIKAPVVIIGVIAAPFEYYNQKQMQAIDYLDISKVKYEQNIWLVSYAQPIFDADNFTEKTLMEEYGFKEVSEKNFVGDIKIKYLYNPNGLYAYDYWN